MNRLPKMSLPPWRLLHVRLALIGVALFVLVQAVSYVLVQQHFERSLYFSERDTLRNGEAAVNRLAAEHIQALIARGRVLAAQPDVVQALRRGDHPALPAPQGDGNPGSPLPLNGTWIEPAFWHRVLTGETTAVPASPALIPANRLRRSMNADWGYGFIEKVVA